MISFSVKPNGSFNVKSKGLIHYKFKGLAMRPEPATVIEQTEDLLVVNREIDQQLIHFIKTNTSWLLKDNNTTNSLLYGTCFTFEK